MTLIMYGHAVFLALPLLFHIEPQGRNYWVQLQEYTPFDTQYPIVTTSINWLSPVVLPFEYSSQIIIRNQHSTITISINSLNQTNIQEISLKGPSQVLNFNCVGNNAYLKLA